MLLEHALTVPAILWSLGWDVLLTEIDDRGVDFEGLGTIAGLDHENLTTTASKDRNNVDVFVALQVSNYITIDQERLLELQLLLE